MKDSILSVKNLEKRFSGLRAVADLSFDVREGDIKGIIGPNGAGKTTLFNIITGLLPGDKGEVNFLGKNILGMKAHDIARLGISRTFQNIQIFGNMTVIENVMVGLHSRTRTGFIKSALRLPGIRKEENITREKAQEMLHITGLEEYADSNAESLAFGLRRKLEVARALATSPKLLALDEPASGLNISETEEFGAIVKKIRDLGITILLVEHDMSLVMNISDEILVLDHGSHIAEGTPRDVQRDPCVIEVYLGSEDHFAGEVH